jgi:predicted SAM-dependent methyltransferase
MGSSKAHYIQMKIEFGCGETPTKEGFMTCDIRDVPGVDFACPAWDIDKHVESNTVTDIFSRHFFEHLTFKQGGYLLEVWHNILKPSGRVEMLIPNMRVHVQQWLDKDARAQRNIYGHQRGNFLDVWDVHKSGYDVDTLRELVTSKGYTGYCSLASGKSKHVHVEFFKP